MVRARELGVKEDFRYLGASYLLMLGILSWAFGSMNRCGD